MSEYTPDQSPTQEQQAEKALYRYLFSLASGTLPVTDDKPKPEHIQLPTGEHILRTTLPGDIREVEMAVDGPVLHILWKYGIPRIVSHRWQNRDIILRHAITAGTWRAVPLGDRVIWDGQPEVYDLRPDRKNTDYTAYLQQRSLTQEGVESDPINRQLPLELLPRANSYDDAAAQTALEARRHMLGLITTMAGEIATKHGLQSPQDFFKQLDQSSDA